MELKDLTLDEKLTLLTGKDCWHIDGLNGKLPEISMSDGPHGMRTMTKDWQTLPATAFPTLSAVGSTWNEELAREMGELIAEEAIERNVDILLAPGVNIKRTPLCGRNFEYFSEDPCLAGELGKAYIEGVQEKGIGTSLKHFAANNREYDRLYQSSEVDERTLREIYFPAFERALQADPWTVMCSYNLVNGVYASEHKKLLNDILRGQFGFKGLIVSDWEAVVNRAKALKASLDLQMPDNAQSFTVLKEAYARGYITDEEIDASVSRILDLINKTQANKGKRVVTHTKEERHAAAVKIAAEGAVLLKNENGVLPFKSGERVYVGGKYAEQGVIGGGGSSYVTCEYKRKNLSDLIMEENPAVTAEYHQGYFCDEGARHGFYNVRKSIALAEQADKAVVVVGFDEHTDCEGTDRTTLKLSPIAVDFILKIARANPRTVVVVYGGSAVDMSDWIGEVSAVLYVNFNGEGGNEAIAKLLTGSENPSGKLQETFPLCLEDTPTQSERGDGYSDRYFERIFVGYRYYDNEGAEVLFPFGHGLSYSSFEYGNLNVQEKNGQYALSFTVKNTSDVDGKEIWQVYTGAKRSLVERPPRELKAFGKVFLKAGEQKTIAVTLTLRDFAYWSTAIDGWRTENGKYTVFVGGSSRDLPLRKEISICLPQDEQPSQRDQA